MSPSFPPKRIVVGGVVSVGVLLSTLLIVTLGRHARALTTPPSVDGMPRMQGPGIEAIADQMRVRMQQGTPELLVGAYGRASFPAFVFVARDSGSTGLASFESAYLRGLSSGFSPGDLDQVTRNSIRYECTTVRPESTTPLSICFFDDGRATGAGLVPDSASTERALRLTSLGRQAAESG